MKFLVDAHIVRLLVDFLVRQGHDVLRATSFPPKTDDEVILSRAVQEQRIVLTSDKDFGELVFRLQLATAGVILLRIDVPSEMDRLHVLEMFWPDVEHTAFGHFVVVTNRSVRRTRLP